MANATTEIEAKQERWQLLVTEHTASFNEVIRIANRYPSDPLLATLRLKAEKGLRALNAEAEAPRFSATPHGYGSLGTWGQNGNGPKIKDMLSTARFYASKHEAAAAERGIAA